ncbi:MAG: hypothetical protein Q7J47_06040 [Azoarcus sp.]|nr:hypothetical protein [Azoarcus sp.]
MLKPTFAPVLRSLEIFTAPAAEAQVAPLLGQKVHPELRDEALLGSVMNEVTAALRGAVV